MSTTLVRLAAAVLSTEKGRKTVGWVIAAILSPLILLAAFLCSFGTAAVEHNNFAVSASFYGPAFTDKIPTEYKDHITEMRTAFSLLDSAVAAVNAKAESGGLDPLQAKAVFYALCFGDNAPTHRAAANFVECFYRLEERTDTTTDVLEDGTVVVQTTVYYVAIPLPLETVYEKLAAWQGEPVTEEDKANAAHIYSMVVGSTGGDTFDGSYTPGGGSGVELDISDHQECRRSGGLRHQRMAVRLGLCMGHLRSGADAGAVPVQADPIPGGRGAVRGLHP